MVGHLYRFFRQLNLLILKVKTKCKFCYEMAYNTILPPTYVKLLCLTLWHQILFMKDLDIQFACYNESWCLKLHFVLDKLNDKRNCVHDKKIMNYNQSNLRIRLLERWLITINQWNLIVVLDNGLTSVIQSRQSYNHVLDVTLTLQWLLPCPRLSQFINHLELSSSYHLLFIVK